MWGRGARTAEGYSQGAAVGSLFLGGTTAEFGAETGGNLPQHQAPPGEYSSGGDAGMLWLD